MLSLSLWLAPETQSTRMSRARSRPVLRLALETRHEVAWIRPWFRNAIHPSKSILLSPLSHGSLMVGFGVCVCVRACNSKPRVHKLGIYDVWGGEWGGGRKGGKAMEQSTTTRSSFNDDDDDAMPVHPSAPQPFILENRPQTMKSMNFWIHFFSYKPLSLSFSLSSVISTNLPFPESKLANKPTIMVHQ